MNHFSKKSISMALVLFVIGILPGFAQNYHYQKIAGWSDLTNSKIQNFLESTVTMKQRKVAVFDCDGTLFGQCPHYLADEALYDYAVRTYKGKKDANSIAKMKIVDQLLHGNNVGVEYVKNRIRFLSGTTSEKIQNIGYDMFKEKYQNKFYPQMKNLLSNLRNFGFEIWIISASPELLYQRFCCEQLGVSEDRMLGVRSLIKADGTVTDQLVYPVPQDEGKAEVVNTFIKAQPLFAAGNSRGDMEMMNTSVGLKLILNPDNTKKEAAFGGKTCKEYWAADPNCVTEYVRDVPENDYKYVCDQLGVKKNAVSSVSAPEVVTY